MQLISALFDAPVPAGLALATLSQAAVAPADMGVWPPLPALLVPPPPALLLADCTDMAAALRRLTELGLPAEAVDQAREGLLRGAILVLARTPDLTATSVAAGLERCGPLGPEAALAWSRDGGLRYRWAELPEPFLSTNPASLSEFTPVLEPEPALTLEADLTLEPAPAPNTAGGGEVS